MPTVESHHGAYIIYGRGHGKEGTLVQVDYEFPAVAQDLGWSLRRVQLDKAGRTVHLSRAPRRNSAHCDHRETDGTITCSNCGITASDFIDAAGEFLSRKAGGF